MQEGERAGNEVKEEDRDQIRNLTPLPPFNPTGNPSNLSYCSGV